MKKLTNKYDFKKAITFAILVSTAVVVAAIIAQNKVEENYKNQLKAEEQIFRDGWEVGHFTGLHEGYENAKQEDWNMLNKNPEIVRLLKKYFPEYSKARVMAAVLQHESQFQVDAKSYNCYYTNKQGKKYSTFCKKGDEQKAWSVDCGIAMLNYHGKVCPAYTFDPELALIKSKELVEKRGFNPWVSYQTGAYKKYLK
jgi:hypothetical protein